MLSSELPDCHIDDRFLEFELIKNLPKPQGKAYKILVGMGPNTCFASAILPRVNAWLKKYVGTEVSLEQLSDIKFSLIHASSHFAAGAIKTLTNAWCTSNRFGSQNGQGSKCIFCGRHSDSMQHILICPTFRTASIAAFNRATFKINGTHLLCNQGEVKIIYALGLGDSYLHPCRFFWISGACHLYHKLKNSGLINFTQSDFDDFADVIISKFKFSDWSGRPILTS